SPAANANLTTTTPTITGTAADTNLQNVTVSIDGGSFVLATGTTSWSFTTSTLTQGAHTVQAKATDKAGNTATTANRTFRVDTVAPAAPVITVPAASAFVNTGTPTISGTAEANSVVTVKEGVTTLGTATTNAAGSWSLTSSSLSQGSHTITATATDAAGNTSPASAVRTLTVDTNA